MMDGADYRELPANGGVDDLITMWKMRKKSLPSPRRSASGARAAARAGGPRRPRRPQVARRTGGIVTIGELQLQIDPI